MSSFFDRRRLGSCFRSYWRYLALFLVNLAGGALLYLQILELGYREGIGKDVVALAFASVRWLSFAVLDASVLVAVLVLLVSIGWRIVAMVLALAIALFWAANRLYFSYYSDFIGLRRLSDIDDAWLARSHVFRQLLDPTALVLVGLGVVGAVFLWKLPKLSSELFRRVSRPYLAVAILAPLLLPLAFTFERMSKGLGVRETRMVKGAPIAVLTSGFLPVYGDQLLEMTVGEFKQAKPLPPPGPVNPAPSQTPPAEDVVGLSSDSDIVFLQLESVDGKAVDFVFPSGRKLMPFLHGLSNESISFTDFYVHHNAGGSSAAEFASLLSILPSATHNGFKTMRYDIVPSLNQVIAPLGFRSMFFHGNRGDIYLRTPSYRKMRFDRFHDGDSFHGAAKGLFTARDLPFFQQTLELVDSERASFPDSRLFLYIVALQSHGPFENYDPMTRVDLLKEQGFDSYTRFEQDYLCSVAEVDEALRYFFSQQHRLRNPVFFLFSDHNSGVFDPGGGGAERVPFLIHGLPDQADWDTSAPASLLDLAPTVCELLGLAPAPGWIGSSLAQEGRKRVIFSTGEVRERLPGQEPIWRSPDDQRDRVFLDYCNRLQP